LWAVTCSSKNRRTAGSYTAGVRCSLLLDPQSRARRQQGRPNRCRLARRIVSDAALTTRINVARNAIGDSGYDQRLIKTLPRRGFRFVGAVQEGAAAAVAPTPMEAPRPLPALPDKPSIAVLPFANLSSNPEQEYLADGIVQDVITELSRFSELFVIARNSSFQYKGKSADVRQVARELGVRYVLEGSIRHGGKRIRIAAQLIDAATGAHRWAERYDCKLEDVFAVQDEVVRTIVTILAAHEEGRD